MNSLFPYKPRKYQEQIVETVIKCLQEKKNLVLEAPAGSGKTICVLSPCLSFAEENGLGIIYVTRTNSQQKQAIKELKKIAGKIDIRATGVQGKTNMCLLIDTIPSLKNGSNEEISRICANRKRKSIEAMRGKEEWNRCIFFENFLLNKDNLHFDRVISAEELVLYGSNHGICPYEVNKMLLRKSNVAVAPYIYIFDEFLREKFFIWFPFPPEKTILIVDEAHNLPSFCRELLSFSLSLKTVKAGQNEAKEYGVKEKSIFILLEKLEEILSSLHVEEDALLEEGIMEEKIEEEFSLREIEKIANNMILYGDVIADIKESKNMLPRSFLRTIGNFLLSWLSLDARWAKIVEREEDNIRVVAYCLDSSIASSILNSFYCSIHMSGTLQPIDEYKKSVGIEAVTAVFPSPFPKENRRIFYVGGITTKYYMADSMVEKIASYIENICNSIHRNMLVFFPSYSIMERFIDKINVERKLYVEEKNGVQSELMDKIEEFKLNGGIFFSVMGGKISEGMDFPSEELEVVVIVGIPYPPPSARQHALQIYYDKKYGNGWKYAFEAPAVRKTLQAIGRLIRKESDKGVAIILDERARRFQKYVDIKKMEGDIIMEVNKFLG